MIDRHFDEKQLLPSPFKNQPIISQHLLILWFSKFRIEENYQEVVGTKVAEFESHLDQQLVSIINTKPENIINLKTWPGSIEVGVLFHQRAHEGLKPYLDKLKVRGVGRYFIPLPNPIQGYPVPNISRGWKVWEQTNQN